ncbi:hypothetical protein TorRG33x02_320970 [Trema orientale]|uniref:Uncharacterized protein n=1 Tax=Trema orientale TaxID=63057 RepID=A0A2P5BHM2_TREOI|nr:hypothetical protein TorRG33x02_320970 [Trema orientale]
MDLSSLILVDFDSIQPIRSKHSRSLVAESSTTAKTDFFFENDGKGSELYTRETANADSAYMSDLFGRPKSSDPPPLSTWALFLDRCLTLGLIHNDLLQ